MKRSRRLIRNTIIGINVLSVLYVGATRLYADEGEPVVRHMAPESLAALRDFTGVHINADVSVEIVQQAGFSVDFTPTDADSGLFVARVYNGSLDVFATNSPEGSHLRIGMPELRDLIATQATTMTVTGFSGDTFALRTDRTPQVELRNNHFEEWRISSGITAEVKFDQASLRGSTLKVVGPSVISVLD
jgi:hypothetical protein